MPEKNKERFSDRVEDYVKYRPHYPPEMIELLKGEIGLKEADVIADIGGGTGISTFPFLNNQNLVYLVEPNQAMRSAAELTFKGRPNFRSVSGTAERTGLQSQTIDMIFCGQAFHWFDLAQSKKEFSRILKKDGHIVLAWNQRSQKGAFLQAYEQILTTYVSAYKLASHRKISDEVLRGFFAPKILSSSSIPNIQFFDETGLKGRLLSSSYCPKDGPEFNLLMKKIGQLFQDHQKDGKVRFDYKTTIYWC